MPGMRLRIGDRMDVCVDGTPAYSLEAGVSMRPRYNNGCDHHHEEELIHRGKQE